MKKPPLLLIGALLLAMAGGCSRKEDTPVDRAVESAKGALGVRDHEKLKEAGENARDALKDAGQGIKDEAQAAKDKANEHR